MLLLFACILRQSGIIGILKTTGLRLRKGGCDNGDFEIPPPPLSSLRFWSDKAVAVQDIIRVHEIFCSSDDVIRNVEKIFLHKNKTF